MAAAVSAFPDKQSVHYEKFMRVMKKRVALRESCSDDRKTALDNLLSTAVYSMVKRRNTIAGKGIGRETVGLLNQGASLPINAKYEENMEALVLMLENVEITKTCERRIFYVLNNFVGSACVSWFTDRIYVGNADKKPPYFIMVSFLSGDSYFTRVRQCWSLRHRCWSLFQRMVWCWEYKKDSLLCNITYPSDGYRRYFPGFDTAMNIVWNSCKCGNAIPAQQDLEMMKKYATFMRPRFMMEDWVNTHCYFSRPNTVGEYELLWMIKGSAVYKEYIKGSETGYCGLLNTLSQDQQHRAYTLKLVRDAKWQRWFLRDDIVFELCRRKERKIFEELLRYNRRATLPCIPRALQILQSTQVRGCKQRLINELRQAYQHHLS